MGLSGIFGSPCDERQTGSGPLLVLAENATAHALFQPSRDEVRCIAANVAKPAEFGAPLPHHCHIALKKFEPWLEDGYGRLLFCHRHRSFSFA